jgi:hypothetical protein
MFRSIEMSQVVIDANLANTAVAVGFGRPWNILNKNWITISSFSSDASFALNRCKFK